MREFIIENLSNTETLNLAVVLLNNIVSVAAALLIMAVYRLSYSGTAYSHKFNVSLGAITLITTMIMSIISNNIALSLGMVGALSIIRFRTAVKDVRDAAFIFWAIAVGIGCGVSQYVLVGVGSLFLMGFFLVTRNLVSSTAQLLVVQCEAEILNKVTAMIGDYFSGKAHLCVKNVSGEFCEMVYRLGTGDLEKATKKNMVDITQRLAKVTGVIRVTLTEQQDDIAR